MNTWDDNNPRPVTPLLTKVQQAVLFIIAVVGSHIEAALNRISVSTDHGHRIYHGPQRRNNPRRCVLCGGPMQKDFRGSRDVRGLDGKIRRVSADVLEWFRCGRCHQSQQGVIGT